jgi:murein DD-endopeptidase MepM/ murein hydrolase activator NlpD
MILALSENKLFMTRIYLLLSITLLLFSCNTQPHEFGLNYKIISTKNRPKFNSPKDSLEHELRSLNNIDSSVLALEFMLPVGPPDAKGYYNAQNFAEPNAHYGNNLHLGEDWNGVGGGNTDLGDSVFAIANGVVYQIGYAGPGWGGVILINHIYPSNDSLEFVQSLYGHLNLEKLSPGEKVFKGQQIGTMDNLNGSIYAHTHLELRKDISSSVGGGYSLDTSNHINPTKFIQSHRNLKK